MRATRAIALAVALAALALAGCRVEEELPPSTYAPPEREVAGEPRGFLLGFSAIPHVLTDEAYLETFDFAAAHGEVLLIQRAPLWEAFLPDAGGPPPEVLDQLKAERQAARQRGLSLVVALDVFDPTERARLNALPASHLGRSLDDPDLRRALIAEAVAIARHERPSMLAIGSEVNATFERDPAAYDQFLSVYREIYEQVKEVAPAVTVFPTFQYEELLGVIPWQPPHAPRWELLEAYEGRIDLFAITTYPSFAYAVARKVPPRYYLQILDHTDLDVAFASAGYASAAGREGFNSSTAPEQRRFLQRLLDDVEALGSPLLIWFASRDLAFANGPPFDLLGSIGLLDADAQPKEAWPAWVEASKRPVDLEAGQLPRSSRRLGESAAPAARGS